MGKGLVSMVFLLSTDATFLVRQAFMGGNGLCVHAFLYYHLGIDVTSHSFSSKV